MIKKQMNRRNLLFILILILILLRFFTNHFQQQAPSTTIQGSLTIEEAKTRKLSDLQVTGIGVVIRLLPDDLKGDRHQKFIVSTEHGTTLLVAHNIDIAPRVDDLKVGDTVEFYGEYEYNEHGGVIHWTHRDPGGRHPDGWLLHGKKRYQ